MLKNCTKIKLKASSIIESTIAIAIIAACILMATIVFVKVVSIDTSLQDYKVKHKIFETIIKENTINKLSDEDILVGKKTIHKETEEIPNCKGVKKILLGVEESNINYNAIVLFEDE